MTHLSLFVVTSVVTQAPPPQIWVRELRDGVTYRHEYNAAIPLSIHSVRFRFPSPELALVPGIGNGRLLAGAGEVTRARVSSIAELNHAIAAVNADFFSPNGDPIGLFIWGSELISDPFAARSAFGWNSTRAVIGAPTWSAVLQTPAGARVRVDGVNRSAGRDEVVLVSEAGGRALASQDALMFVLDAPGMLMPSGEFEARFRFVIPDVREVPVKDGEWVIVATGSRRASLLSGLTTNSTFRFRMSLVGGSQWDGIAHAIGGGPRLLTNGKITVRGDAEKFPSDIVSARHPRTAIGITKSGDVVFVVVDGRSTTSRGATLTELASILRALGCRDAMNLDGGGSATLFAFGAVLNEPSDGQERPVSNALLLLAPRPNVSPDLRLSIVADAEEVFVGEVRQLRIVSADGTAVNPTKVVWSASGKSARVNQDGVLTVVAPGKVSVRANYLGSVCRKELTCLPRPPPTRELGGAGIE